MKTLLSILVFSLLAVAQQTRQERIVICTDAGSTDTYACSPTPAATSYTTGLRVRLYAPTANTGAATVNLSTLGAKSINKVAGGVTTALDDNDIRAGQYVDLIYDGTNFQMLSQLGNAATGGGGSTVYGEGAALGRFLPFVSAASSAVGTSTSLITRYIQFSLPAGAVFNALLFTVNAAATNNCGGGSDPCALAFALYDHTGALVANSVATGAAPTATGAASAAMAANTTLTAGTYFLAYATNSSALNLGGTTGGLYAGVTLNTGLDGTNYRVFQDASGDVVTVSGTTTTMKSSLVTSGRVAWNPTNMLGVVLVRN